MSNALRQRRGSVALDDWTLDDVWVREDSIDTAKPSRQSCDSSDAYTVKLVMSLLAKVEMFDSDAH